ncbi:MAG: RdgB/HAM1 family non-canonical purine NTP pyrophosphatase [Phycisphaerales bacterium]|nr:RdgB/HAM1 family non-canonical purine NTP pyrophosphatase [Phycisphaerales bacterium]
MPTIVFASQNPGKIRELQALTQGQNIDIIGLGDLDRDFDEPVEDGRTFLENATIKAVQYAKETGLHCLADDSGLIVDALDGKPGVISSHFAFDGDTEGEAAGLSRQERDDRNNERLLRDLEGIPDDRRTARFTCTMVLASPDGEVLAHTKGEFEGRIGQIGEVPRGDNGFGYDPLFLVAPRFDRTSAQMTPDEKNTVSHRAKAVAAMIDKLGSVFTDS